MASSSKKKKIQQMELQDAQGISRKKWKYSMNPNLFIFIKLIIIALIPLVYFLYSPLLIFVFIAYIGLFFLARMAEHSLNKSVIRSNHIHISKIDSGIALVVVLIAIFGGFLSTTQKNKESLFQGMTNTEFVQQRGDMDFTSFKKESKWLQVKQKLITIGSLLTGERNLFEEEKTFNFTPAERPKDFISDSSEIPELPVNSGIEFDGGSKPGGGRGKNFDFSVDDIPINYVTSSAMSTINTVLIFSVSGFGLISICSIYFKKRKFEREMSEVIVESKIEMLSNGELERILSFGEYIEEVGLSKKEINKKIKLEKLKSKAENIEDNLIIINPEEEKIEILEDDFNID